MNIWPATALVSGQSRLGVAKIRIILNIALILHFYSCVKDGDLKEILVNPYTNKYQSIKRSRPFDRSLIDFLSGLDHKHIS